MANIYREQVKTDGELAKIGDMSAGKVVKQNAKAFDVLQDNFERQANEHQKLANTLYFDGSKIAIHNGLEELSHNPELSADPEGFAKEADKMANDVYGQIQDPDIKARVVLDYELKKTPYVNSVYRNYYKQQREQQQAQADERINGYFDTLSLSFGNLLNDTVSVDDFLNIQNATKGIDEVMNEKDLQGYDLLTPSQRREIDKRRNKLLQNAVIGAINDASYAQQMKIINDISEDKFEMIKDLQDSLGGKEVQMGGLENYLTPESVDYVKKYARGVKDRYEKLSKKKLSDKQALDKAHTQTIYDLELPIELKEIGKMEDGSDKTYAYMDGRLRAEELYRNGDIDEKTYNKYMKDSAVPLVMGIGDVEGAEQHWFGPNGAFEDSINVLQTLDMVPEEKAYAYTRAYNELSKMGIDADSTDSSDKNNAKQIAVDIKKDYLEKKNANLIGTDVNKVLLGNGKLETYQEPKEPKPAKNAPFRIWESNDGRKFKVLPDKNGNYTNDSVVIDLQYQVPYYPIGNNQKIDSKYLDFFTRMLFPVEKKGE